jgi:hypothetical protein
MYVCVSMNIYIYIWNFHEQRWFYVPCVMPHLIVALHAVLMVQSSLLLLVHYKLHNSCLITGMLSSRMHKLVIVVAHMADIDPQNARNYVEQLIQHPVKKVCLMLCSTLDGWVCCILSL